MQHTFNYNIETLGELKSLWEDFTIKNEPMIFGGDLEFANKNGGILTWTVLDFLINKCKLKFNNPIIDTRVTMTMEGSYPSIPGWHCDDVPRHGQYNQPDLSKISSEVQHYMCLFSSVENHTCTEFIIDKPTFEFDYAAEFPIWGQLDNKIEQAANLKTKFIKPGEVIKFDQNAIHRASPTKKAGWRFFFRLSETFRQPKNEIRQQVQIYTPIGRGW